MSGTTTLMIDGLPVRLSGRMTRAEVHEYVERGLAHYGDQLRAMVIVRDFDEVELEYILRGPEWVRTEDRLPTAEDGVIGATGEPEVLAVTKYAHGYFPDMKMVSKIREALGRKYYPYWMPLPKLPEVEG